MSTSVMDESVERADVSVVRPPDPVSLPSLAATESSKRVPIVSSLVELAKRVSQIQPSQPTVPKPATTVHARPQLGFD